MLNDSGGGNRPHLAVLVPRKDIALPDYIAVRPKPAGQAAIEPPPGFVSVIAMGAGLRTIALVYEAHAFGMRLVLYVLAYLAVVPAASLLISLLAERHLVRGIAQIPDGYHACPVLNSGVHDPEYRYARDAFRPSCPRNALA
jgi:hypothetical protein